MIRTDLDSVEKLFVGQTVSGTTYKGLAAQLDELMDSFLDATGLLPEKLEALDARIVDIEKDRAVFDARIQALEERTLRRFNAMDLLLGEITSTGDMLNIIVRRIAWVCKPAAKRQSLIKFTRGKSR